MSEGDDAYYLQLKENREFKNQLLLDNYNDKLPKAMFGHSDPTASIAKGEFGWYISYAYKSEKTYIYLFHLLDMQAWQACLSYLDGSKESMHTSNHERWPGAWKELRARLNAQLDLTEIVNSIDAKDITLDQIVEILIME